MRNGIEDQRMTIACHEAGHALIGLSLGLALRRVSLNPMPSANGTSVYLAVTEFEYPERPTHPSLEDALRDLRVSVGGFAGEMAMFDGRMGFNVDDLLKAAKAARLLIGFAEYREFAHQLPDAEPSGMEKVVSDPLLRSIIEHEMLICAEQLRRDKSVLKLISQRLNEETELSRDHVTAILQSHCSE